MMQPLALPAAVEQNLKNLEKRIRWLRLVRGVSTVALWMIIPFIALLAADSWFYLSEEWLAPILGVYAVTLLIVAYRSLVAPLARRIDYTSLAGWIEQHHPELLECLSSSVQLVGTQPFENGSPRFAAILLQQTESQTHQLDFRDSFSQRPVWRWVIASSASLALIVLAGTIWPGHFRDFSHRFFLAWFAGPALQFEVQPGNAIIAHGEPLTVDVLIQRRSERIAWPEACTLILQDDANRQQHIPMHSTGVGSYRGYIEHVQGNLHYYIAAAGRKSDWFHIQAVEPALLALGSPTFHIQPPEYVNAELHPTKKLTAPSELEVLQFSQIEIAGQLVRPVQKASLEIVAAHDDRTSQPNAQGVLAVLPVALAPDRHGWSISLPILDAGTYQLTLVTETEHPLRTRHALATLKINADAPPRIVHVGGALQLAAVQSIPPGDSLHLLAQLQDDEGLGAVQLLYRINGGGVQTEKLAAVNGRIDFHLDHQFPTAGKLKNGDRLEYCLQVTDNRQIRQHVYRDMNGTQVPANDLGPHIVHHPASDHHDWLSVKMDQHAKPMREQELAAEHAGIRAAIEQILKELQSLRQQTADLAQASRLEAKLDRSKHEKLQLLLNQSRQIEDSIRKLAKTAAKTSALQPIHDVLSSIADEDVQQGSSLLQNALTQQDALLNRRVHLNQADSAFARAQKRLEELLGTNDQLARDRLDQLKLEQLANKEFDLSKKVDMEEPKLPSDDEGAKEKLEKLQDEQKQIAEEFQKLLEDSNLLHKASDAMMAEHANMLGQKAAKLAQEQRQVAEDAGKVVEQQKQQAIAEFAKAQKELVEPIEQARQQVLDKVKDRPLPPLNASHAADAARSLQQEALLRAIQQQERMAMELDRVAVELEKQSSSGPASPSAMQQLAKLQQELYERLMEEGNQLAQRTPEQLAQALQAISQEQAELMKAIQKLRPQDFDDSARKDLMALNDQAADASRYLRNADALRAFESMKQTQESLQRLAPFMKPMPVQQKSDDGQKLQQEAARKQAEQLRGLAKNQRDLRDRVKNFMEKANLPPTKGDDLRDVAQHQEQVRRQVEKLIQALEDLARSTKQSQQVGKSSQQAADAAKQAGDAMMQSEKTGKEGDALQAQQAAANAADRLEEAARQAMEAGKKLAQLGDGKNATNDGSSMQQTAQSLQQGQAQMTKAQQSLQNGQMKQASQSMQQAADSLQKAAGRLGMQLANLQQPQQSMPGKTPGAIGPLPPGLRGKAASEINEKYSGKSWGEVPGELKARILMEMRAQYGEEYAAIIRRYFEQIADTSRPPQPKPPQPMPNSSS